MTFLLVTFTPLTDWVAYRLAGPWPRSSHETLIVLTGGITPDGFLSADSVLRTHYAEREYHKGGVKKIIISGGGEPSTSQAMADLLAASNVPREIIVAESVSLSTHDSAVQVAQMLRNVPGEKTLMTSDYHMLRASRAFRKAGLEFNTVPVPDAIKRSVSHLQRWNVFLDEAAELIKLAYYKARGWI